MIKGRNIGRLGVKYHRHKHRHRFKLIEYRLSLTQVTHWPLTGSIKRRHFFSDPFDHYRSWFMSYPTIWDLNWSFSDRFRITQAHKILEAQDET